MELPQAMAGSFADNSGPQSTVADAPAEHNDSLTQDSLTTGASTADPSIPNQNGTCYLLQIPVEIRLIISEFALSEPRGLFCCPKGDDPAFKLYTSLTAATTPGAKEANQLKYVCRQLREETSGMGLRLNDLNFVRTDMSQLSPLIHFELFNAECTPKKQGQIHNAIMRDDIAALSPVSEPSADTIAATNIPSLDFAHYWSTVDALCAAYPKTTFHIQARYQPFRLPGLPSHTYHVLFLAGITLQAAFCDRNLSAKLYSYPSFQRIIDSIKLYSLFPGYRPANLQFWPITEHFDEEAFRKQWTKKEPDVRRALARMKEKIVRHWPGGIDSMVQEVKTWYSEGILRDFY